MFNTDNITVYATPVNCGDGSSSIDWFLSRDILAKMEEHYPEDYAMGDVNEYTFPNNFDFKAMGISFFSDEDCLERLKEAEYV